MGSLMTVGRKAPARRIPQGLPRTGDFSFPGSTSLPVLPYDECKETDVRRHADFPVNRFHMAVNGVVRDAEAVGDLGVCESVRKGAGHVGFRARQTEALAQRGREGAAGARQAFGLPRQRRLAGGHRTFRLSSMAARIRFRVARVFRRVSGICPVLFLAAAAIFAAPCTLAQAYRVLHDFELGAEKPYAGVILDEGG